MGTPARVAAQHAMADTRHRIMAAFDIRELLRASAYPHDTGAIELRETHVSWIVLTGSFAYKVKKPVRLDFLDMTSLPDRHALCEEELRLNRRLAADLYLEVVPICRGEGGAHIGGDGPIVEYAVKMREFDAAEELPALLERGDVTAAEIAALARRLAAFHGQASPGEPESDAAYRVRFGRSVLGTLATLISHAPAESGQGELGQLTDWVHDALHDEARRIEERHALGFVRECHGDLHAANIVRWHGELTPFDCLEFDRGLRTIDVMSDIAFLFMDLVSRGRRDLGHELLSTYLEATGDYGGLPLLPLYGVYRALVRAMVDALSAEQRPALATACNARLLARLRTAEELANPAVPTLLIMHGVSGSGKSWLSGRLVAALGAIRIRSDVERKRAPPAGAAPAEDLYAPEGRARIYARLLECAAFALGAGLTTIVDATFLSLADRERFESLAERLRAHLLIVCCTASSEELRRRLASRGTNDPSDANAAVLERQLCSAQPLTAEEESRAIHLDTTAADCRARVAARVRSVSQDE